MTEGHEQPFEAGAERSETARQDRDEEPEILAFIRSAPAALGELEIDRSEPPARS